MHKLRSLLVYLWALPATAVGLVLALFARMGGATALIIDGVIEVAGGRLGRVVSTLPPRFRFSAITFGHVVIGISHSVLEDCRAHERVHVRQYERWGILFFVLYLGSSALEALRGRNPYWDNHFERQARERAARVWS